MKESSLVAVAVLVSSVSAELYCPSQNDLIVAYTTPGATNTLTNQGWMNKGGGAAATKSSFNLLGGSVEYDLDLRNVKSGVNANIYTVSPKFKGPSFEKSFYCDGAATGADWCVEVDWIESNGNCGGATTLHTVEGPGNDGCSAWGCRNQYHYNGVSKFHMKIDYGLDGTWTTTHDGVVIDSGMLNPNPKSSDWATLKQQYTDNGAVIYSSIWVGWVPVDDCGTAKGDLANSYYSVANLTINGTVVQGPTPTKCGSGPSPPSPPSPPPPPPPCTDPNGGKTSDGTPCATQKKYNNCGASWMKGWCCATCFNCSGANRCGGRQSAVDAGNVTDSGSSPPQVTSVGGQVTQCSYPKQAPIGPCTSV
jgi:hypothetical protein